MKTQIVLVLIGALFATSSAQGVPSGRAWGGRPCTQAPNAPSRPNPWPAGTQIRVECPPGYAFVAQNTGDGDDRVTTCRADGQWNKRLGSCIRIGPLCTKPVTSSIVQIEEQSAPTNESPNKYEVGAFIRYRCPVSYYLSGARTLNCLSNGQWDNSPPTCRRDIVTPAPPPPQRICRMPVFPTNGDIYSQTEPVADGTSLNFPPGGRIRFECNPGYTLQGQATINCMSNGQWDRQVPDCRRNGSPPTFGGQTCRDPLPSLRNGYIARQHSINNFGPGSTITYGCYSGYDMIGPATIRCDNFSRWDNPVPECRSRFVGK